MALEEEKAPELSSETGSPSHPNEITLFGETSPGVKRIEFISANISFVERIILFIGVFLIAYTYGLDGTLRYVYQPAATNGFSTHSLLATITVLRSVISAAAQPTYAKIADVFGRVELLSVSILFYIIGTIVEATSHGVKAFAAGAVLYQVGYTGAIFLVEVIIGDLTSLRSRLFFSFIPATPFIINTWVSGDISEATLKVTSWRWGIGMWGIIYPVSAIPLIVSMYLASRRAKRVDGMPGYTTPYKMYGFRKLAVALFWQLDVVGIILMIAVFALILVPLTIAGGFETKWKEAHVLAPLIIGICTLPVFIWWEKTAKHPLIPFHLLKDRAIWGGIGIAISLNTAWYLQGDYLYTVLVVAFNESIKSATRITSFYSFFSVITGVLLGVVVFFVRRLKPFIVFGTCLFMVAFGILINYRGGVDRSTHAGLIGGQVLLGVAGGLFPYPAQASVQAATRHEHLAIVTGIFLASYNIGGALGNAISGAIWNQVLPRELSRRLERLGNATLPAYAYGSPFYFVADYPVGTPAREAVVEAYKHTQRLLCIAGICITIPLIAFSLALRNPKLTQQQSLAYAEHRDRKKEILAGEENA